MLINISEFVIHAYLEQLMQIMMLVQKRPIASTKVKISMVLIDGTHTIEHGQHVKGSLICCEPDCTFYLLSVPARKAIKPGA